MAPHRAQYLRYGLALAVAIGIAVVVAKGILGHLEKQRTAKLETEQRRRAVVHAISELASRTNAVRGWEIALAQGEKVRVSSVLTVELEQLWLGERPILFLGAITDIQTATDTEYTVTVERDALHNSNPIILANLVLSLRCDKKLIDSFLRRHPDLFKFAGLSNGVAVVARIDAIRTERSEEDTGSGAQTKVGEGRCVDIVHVGWTRIDEPTSAQR